MSREAPGVEDMSEAEKVVRSLIGLGAPLLLTSLGIQTLFFSFVASILGLRRKGGPAV